MTEPTWADHTSPTTVEVRGLPTAYRRKGSGEVLLYLHGACLTRRWLPLYEELSQSYDVIVPEHPGFGDTPLPDWVSGLTDLVIHYADFLDVHGIDKVHLVGHSFGGWLAAEFAAFYPERLHSLTLVAPGGLRPDADEPMPDIFRMTEQESLNALLGADGPNWTDYLAEGDPAVQKITEYREGTALARVAWNPRYDLKLERRLQRVGVPAQVIVPERDGVNPPSVARKYAQILPHGSLATLTGAATPTEHLLIIQEPRRLAAQIATTAGVHA